MSATTDIPRIASVYCEKCGETTNYDTLFVSEPFVCPICVDTCEHDQDAATCDECHGPFGVGA